jgi:hypothetical protein
MKLILSLFLLSLVLTSCGRRDAISQQVIGTWHQGEYSTTVFNPDGSYSSSWVNKGQTNDYANYAGTWQIRDGMMVMTLTNVSSSDHLAKIGDVRIFKIIHVDGHNLSYEYNGHAISLNR